jgi:8-oxo-dGTP diphosphatase
MQPLWSLLPPSSQRQLRPDHPSAKKTACRHVEFPGGKLDGNESPRDCLRREIIEELDLEVAVGDILEAAYYRYDWGPVLILAFECRPLAGEIRNLQVAEHRWVALEELASFALLPADYPIVETLLRSR